MSKLIQVFLIVYIVCFLLSLIDKDDLDMFDEEAYLDDLTESKCSPFSKLILDEKNLKVKFTLYFNHFTDSLIIKTWLHFTSLSGEEQEKYIREFEELTHRQIKQKLGIQEGQLSDYEKDAKNQVTNGKQNICT